MSGSPRFVRPAVSFRGFVAAIAAAVALTVGGAGCATAGENPFDESAAGDRTVQFTIRNQNFNDATVHALWEGGARNRVGNVTGNSTRTFTTRHRGEVVRFEVDFLAGGDYVTESIAVAPGDHVQLTLRPGGG